MSDYEVIVIDQCEDRLTYFALFLDCNSTTFEILLKMQNRKR